mgnify:CR=1 FL=1
MGINRNESTGRGVVRRAAAATAAVGLAATPISTFRRVSFRWELGASARETPARITPPQAS